MNTNKNSTKVLEDVKISTNIKLSALWAAAMFCYVYGDIFSFFRTGHIADIMAGKMGPFPVSQVSLLGVSIFMGVPAVMVFLSLVLKPKVNRLTNIILGIFYTIANSVSFLTDTWAYFIFLGIVENTFTALIVWYAFKWPKQEA
jgi:hypothetical protein